jgi:hypothetical protein
MLLITPTYLISQSLTQNFPLQQVAGTVVNKAGTITGTAGVGSSLFLQRLMIPAAMTLNEIDIALSISFPATNQGAGTMSRSMVIYSIGNNTSLASLLSVSGSSVWETGTSTAGGNVSLTQFQGGWSTPLIQPLTFGSSLLPAGEYVVGQLFDFAQGSSSWTINFYGANAISTFLASAGTNLTSAALGAMSSGGLLAASAFTASASSALTAFTIAPTAVNAMLSNALLAGSIHTASSSSALTAFTAAPTAASVMSSTGLSLFATGLRMLSLTNSSTGITIGATATNGALSGLSAISTGTFTRVAGSYFTASGSNNVISNAGTAGMSLLASGGLLAGSFFTAATGSSVVIANAGTAAAALMASQGLLVGSFHTASGSFNAITNVAMSALNSSTLAQITLPNFGFIGTGSTISNYPSVFIAGIMSTGGIPANITITGTNITYSGSFAFQQPWFALIGS